MGERAKGDTNGASAGAVAVRRARLDQPTDGLGATLIELGYDTWVSQAAESRALYLGEIDQRYTSFLDEFYEAANQCGGRFEQFLQRHSRWRRGLIIGTGSLAVINLLAAYQGVPEWIKPGWSLLPLLAAVYAAMLSLLANLESFSNCCDHAQAYRESRELFLDTAREYTRLWDVHVRPFGETPQACLNASELYRRIVVRDRELRAKLKQLTEDRTKSKDGASKGGGAKAAGVK